MCLHSLVGAAAEFQFTLAEMPNKGDADNNSNLLLTSVTEVQALLSKEGVETVARNAKNVISQFLRDHKDD